MQARAKRLVVNLLLRFFIGSPLFDRGQAYQNFASFGERNHAMSEDNARAAQPMTALASLPCLRSLSK
jgi:hypothetical protein